MQLQRISSATTCIQSVDILYSKHRVQNLLTVCTSGGQTEVLVMGFCAPFRCFKCVHPLGADKRLKSILKSGQNRNED